MRAFADDLRAGGHIVHTPDLFDGRIFPSIEEGLAYIEKSGLDDLRMRGVRDDLPFELVYAGFSFGVLPTQQLAQTRPKARGALLFHSCLPVSGEWAFGPWPESTGSVPLCWREAASNPRSRSRFSPSRDRLLSSP